MRSAAIFVLLLCAATAVLSAQQSDPGQDVLTVRSTIVEVPVLVKTQGGEIVFELTADDFLLTDDGVPQHLTLDPDTDSQPLALAIVVETGGAGARHLMDYRQLDPILDALIGNVEHQVAVIGFDSKPHLLLPFTTKTEDASDELGGLNQGDQGAAILDGLAFAVAQLRTQPTRYRRAVLLLSETIDQDSTTTLDEALRLISDTNTAIYSFAFSSTKGELKHEASKLPRLGGSPYSREPYPAGGCMSHGADPDAHGKRSVQALDCASDLFPPLRLARMAFLAATDGLQRNVPESVAQLTGGEYVHFRNAKDLQQGLINLSNDVPNYYVLNFHPTSLAPGLHALDVELKNRPQLELKSRSEYWIDSEKPH